MRHVKILCLTAFVLALFLSICPVTAADGDTPSIFHNDEAWYKDAILPLITRGGKNYVPVEIFGMFDYISVSVAGEDNLLINNEEKGLYISLLFSDGSAVINGEIVNNVRVFREDGVHYADAETVCDAVGIFYEYRTVDSGKTVMRIYDEEFAYDFKTLLETYLTGNDEEYSEETDGRTEFDTELKRIYVLCSQSDDGINKPAFSASNILREYGLSYTMFIYDTSRTDDVIAAAAQGEYGVYISYYGDKSAEDALNEINAAARSITCRISHITLDLYGDDVPSGYHAVSPDFTVNSVTSAEYIYGQISEYLKTNDYCTLYLEDCWNSGQMIALLSGLDEKMIVTSNLGKNY